MARRSLIPPGAAWCAALALSGIAIVALAVGFVLGGVAERVLIRRVEGGPPLNAVIVTIGLLILLQAIAGMIWSATPRSFPPAFSIRGYHVGSHTYLFGPFDVFTVLAVLGMATALLVLFRFTDLGLMMRASAFEPIVARLQGVRVGNMLTLGWALASLAGSLAGLLIGPQVFVASLRLCAEAGLARWVPSPWTARRSQRTPR